MSRKHYEIQWEGFKNGQKIRGKWYIEAISRDDLNSRITRKSRDLVLYEGFSWVNATAIKER